MSVEPKLSPYERDRFYRKGYDAYRNGQPNLFEGAEHSSPEYYMHRGWYNAYLSTEKTAAIEEQEAGLDYESLDKLANQLKALGFTIPNEEN